MEIKQVHTLAHALRMGHTMLVDLLLEPLPDLDRFIRLYPAQFVRGFFDAEGSAVVSVGRNGRLSLRLEASNNKAVMLQYVHSQLRHLHIDSRFGQYNRPERVVSLIRGKPVAFESRTFWLIITKLASIKRFASDVGFTIGRKQQKLTDALNLIGRVGSGKAGIEWLRIYRKEGTRWVKRQQ